MGHGGLRAGSGRPRGAKNKNPQEDIAASAAAENLTPLEFMLRIMRDPAEDPRRRLRMAISAAPYCHPKAGEAKGKKEQQSEKAKAAGSGKFAPSRPPLNLVK